MSNRNIYLENAMSSNDKNIYDEPLKECSCKPLTGFFRNGKCSTSPQDLGKHTVCVQMTKEFLKFSQSRGNDLSTPRPEFGFPGLKPGDKWCLCALRWLEALEAGVVPPVYLYSTHKESLDYIRLLDLEAHAVQAKIIPLKALELANAHEPS